ncbi:trafficking protein particle complex II-specific subunit 120 homolog [Asparagus officinalis]|uniref:trafficking protein particle complex II-specific subunit 120 homolog n=1 Tax=Asparagus officinalis TaxID=4686 RepID=UPI00098E1224|nr:trafficking protein particle complex II-specific subunit 120 homolog [Asparagus officinalis]
MTSSVTVIGLYVTSRLLDSGPLSHPSESSSAEFPATPGRRLVIPLLVFVLQGLQFVKARLLSMELPAHVGKALPKNASVVANVTEELNARDTAD